MGISKITRKMSKNIILELAGLWSELKETGLEYEKRVRRTWKKKAFLIDTKLKTSKRYLISM